MPGLPTKLYKMSNGTGRKAFTYITPKLDLDSSGIDKKISSIKFFLNENILNSNFSFYYRINEVSSWTTLTNATNSDNGTYYKYKISLKVRTIQIKVVGLAAAASTTTTAAENSQLNGISIIYRKFTGR